jgi:predicted esterase
MLFALFLTVSAAGQTTSFTATYTGQGTGATTCNTSFGITGQEPSASGTFPVFVYMVGTTETFNNNGAASAAVAGMASRGFVSASIQYDSGEFGNCTQISGKAKCIFDPSTSTSAIEVLCSRAKADCSKGIVVGGFSQGAVIATLAKNFDSGVQAAWGMGDGVSYTSVFNLNACMANGNRTLDSNHLRAVDGQADEFIGPQENEVRSQLQTLTGENCGSSATSCLQSNGSGWIIVLDSQVQSGNVDHCYMRTNGCLSSETTNDPGWLNGTAPWELNANLNWLAGFAQ